MEQLKTRFHNPKFRVLLGVGFGITLMMTALAAQADGDTIQANFTYLINDANPYGSGTAQTVTIDKSLANGSWDRSGSKGVDLGFASLTADAHTSGTFGLNVNGQFSGGELNGSVPMTATLQVSDPSSVRPGGQVTITTTAQIAAGAAFSATSPSGNLALSSTFGTEADVGLKECGFGSCEHQQATLINVQPATKQLLSISSDNLKYTYNGKYGSVTAQFPALNLSGAINGAALEASAKSPVLSGSLDVSALAANLAGYPAPSGSVDLGLATLNYNLFSSALAASSGVDENITVQPKLVIDLKASTGEEHLVNAGDSAVFNIPESGNLTIIPTYMLDMRVTNQSGIYGDVSLELSALSLGISHIGTLGPLWQQDIGIGDFDATLFDNAWLLGTQDSQGSAFSVQAAPEPASYALIGIGMLIVGSIRRTTGKTPPSV